MAGPGLTGAALAVLLLSACAADPHADEVEPAMSQAVRAVLDATGSGPVERSLLPRCGPTDERQDGLVLTLVAASAGRGDVGAAAQALRRQGHDVTTPGGDGAPLLSARPDDGRWRLEVQRRDAGGVLVTATARVDDASVTPQRPLTEACG